VLELICNLSLQWEEVLASRAAARRWHHSETAEMWEKLADVPDDEFEHHLTDPTHKPTTSGIIRAARHCRSRSLSSP
jgi:hypothetical protein